MAIEQNQAEDTSTIRLDGAIDIASAAQLKATLFEALKTSKKIRVSLGQATGLDITAFQLLWAAERQAKISQIEFTFVEQLPAPVQSSLAEMGLAGLNRQE